MAKITCTDCGGSGGVKCRCGEHWLHKCKECDGTGEMSTHTHIQGKSKEKEKNNKGM